VAIPDAPSSPGAVQANVTEFDVAEITARSVTAAGGIVSVTGIARCVRTGTMFERADQLGTSSVVRRAK